ncbi:MAG TPA: GNAT family N-acetyltransferase [Rhodanobacteraceae bacterium]|nr:GNAT family N-acetyltransferase [Rhodanobacteraceae bacterium]
MTEAGGEILRFSPLESARFGLRVFRAAVDVIDAARIADEIGRERVDVAILRLPATAIDGADALARHGFAPIVADTQVVYGTDLAADARAPADASITLRAATRDDAALLDRMARSIFADYESHYTANPVFSREKIVEGYAEWAARHAGADDGSAAWLVEHDGALAAFSCYRIEPDGVAIGVLNGVLPAARGRGVYRGMLNAMLERFAAMRLPRFEIATQTHNAIVQRVWAQSGLSLRAKYTTLHVNALRGRSERAAGKA